MKNMNAKLKELITAYDQLVRGIEDKAVADQDRAYGGIIRAEKGRLVESLANSLVRIAWEDVLKQRAERLTINKTKMAIGIKDGYTDRIADPRVKAYVTENKEKLVYNFGTDVHVYVDRKLVLPIECKAYTENAMIKRILFDAMLMQEAVGTQTYYLLQLESQLGGDYSELGEVSLGSPATHALLSHADVNLEIITLLKGERDVKRPIHKPDFYKELSKEQLKKVVMLFADALKPYQQ